MKYLGKIVEITIGVAIGLSLFYIILYTPPNFILIYSMEIRDNIVTVDRSINGNTDANWSVDIFDDSTGIVCRGSSDGFITYGESERKKISFIINEYVGDDNCEQSLVDGKEYTMVIQWIPVDNTISPVYYPHRFVYKNS